ncbi:MAG: archaeosine biosynthesis radical SAM protein RaSEA [Thermoplasmata archaeon]|nr:archaeosine biosynthesis radical SAM protein RaSEA [Thermoplasmata archaeon]
MPESVARAVARERRPPPGSPPTAREPVNLWSEDEAIGTDRVRAFVAILRTRGCYWADVKGCSMCGYARDTLGRSATSEELQTQLDRLLERYRGEPYVKVYTSGSFLDDREVDPESRVRLAKAFHGRARRLLFETLPEFATEAAVGAVRDAFDGELEVALGLESTQPEVLGRLINKGETPAEYLAAADRLRSFRVHPKAYLLLKPPYLTEAESVADVIRSVEVARSHFDAISVNPVHIQNGTVVEWLFRRGRYRPPWLWSLVDAMRAGAPGRGATRLVTFPTAGGLPRGPHNCGRCDRTVLNALEEASLSQSFEGLDPLTCECRGEYERWRDLEALGVEA